MALSNIMFRIVRNMVVLLALLCINLNSGVVDGKRSIPSQGREEYQVEEKLTLLNKAFVRSIQSEDGDIIDCVDIYKQPAFDHPLLKNHTIRMSPSFDPTTGDTSAPSILNSSVPFSQVWRKSGSCPDGTIPIRRVLRQHLLNASSLERYGKKNTNAIIKRDFHMLDHTFTLGIEHYHTAAALITSGYSYTGAKADINVWNPPVEADDEYTSGQIWLRNGPFNNSDTIEVGWMVNPSVYGDRRTRLFIYWTNDSGKSTGCFDLLCPGFIQVNKDILLGGTIEPTSSFYGQQYHISLEVVKIYPGLRECSRFHPQQRKLAKSFEMLISNIMVIILLALFCTALSSGVVDGKRSIQFPGEELQVEEKLKLLNKPFVRSIQSEDGDIIDCVDIYKQPAFDHPLLKNHTIRMSPSFDPTKDDTSAPTMLNSSLPFSQVWHRSGSCPDGTIPIRRVLRHHLLNASSLDRYGKKNTNVITKHDFRMLDHTFAVGIEHYHTPAALITSGYSYTGARADINVWNPRVDADDEYTTAQIWLRNGPFNNSDTIELGWMVNPSVYGDRQTRLFIYWTIDSGKSTGCFDLLCPGFVQVNKDILLGGTISPTSAFHGQQYHISLEVVKDFDQMVWWLISRTDNIAVGYWPCNIFNYLFNIAEVVEWGGDVYSPRMHQEPHTATAMGSSYFASEHWSFACFIHQPRMRDYSMTYKYPYPSFPYTPDVNCYSGENYADILFTEPLFYFGGPGRNSYCP